MLIVKEFPPFTILFEIGNTADSLKKSFEVELWDTPESSEDE